MVIEKFLSHYHLPEQAPDPPAVKKRLDRIASTLLTEELDQARQRLLPDSRNIILIRHVGIDLDLDLARTSDRTIARLWAEKITRSLIRRIQVEAASPDTGREEEGMIRYQDQAEYLAHFLSDLASGRTWSKWYYHSFKDLDGLDQADIVGLIFRQNQDIAEPIMLHLLRMGALEQVLEKMTEGDADFVYHQCLGRDEAPTAGDRENAHAGIDAFLQKTMPPIVHRLSPYPQNKSRACLKLYFSFLQKYPDCPCREYLHRAVADWVAGPGASPADPQAAGQKKRPAGQAADGAILSEEWHSPHAGIFLLIPAIQESKLPEAVRQSYFPVHQGIEPMRYVLFHLALNVFGLGKDRHSLDPAFLCFAGFEKPFPGEALLDACNHIHAAAIHAFLLSFFSDKAQHAPGEPSLAAISDLLLRIFTRRLRGFSKSSPEYIRRHFLKRSGRIVRSDTLLQVSLSPMPLDMVLRMAGYMEEIRETSWLGRRRVQFTFFPEQAP